MTEIRIREWTKVDAHDERLRGLGFDDHLRSRELARTLTASGRLSVLEMRDGLQIGSGAHVGRVDLGVCSVVIEPKLPLKRFLNLLQFAYGFQKLDLLESTQHGMAQHGLVELLVHQFLKEVGRIMHRGMRRQYRRTVEHLGTPRGKLLFDGLANGRGWGNASLECEYHERSSDNQLNAALLFGLGLVPGITKDIALRAKARRLAMLLKENVAERPFDPVPLQSLITRLDRQSHHYANALQLVQLLLQGTGVVLEEVQAHAVRVPGFLFDMNRFYQALVARFLRTFLPDLEVLEEQALKGMYRYERNLSELGRRSPQPRPDIVVRKDGAVEAVLDAKYRDIGERGLPRDMLYQLSIYALSGLQAEHRAVVLYPTGIGQRADQVIGIHDPVNNAPLGAVVLRGVDLIAMEAVVNLRDPMLRMAKGKAMARYIVFGIQGTDERNSYSQV